jgi:hypothetical protein
MENENILELTKENLIKCGFDSDVIKQILNRNDTAVITRNKAETFIATTIDNKIYTIIEMHRQIYFKNKVDPEFPVHCLGLIPEYYELALSYYLENSKKRLTLIYDEKTQKEIFRQEELRRCIDAIDSHFNKPMSNHWIRQRPHPVIVGKQVYKTWIENQSEPIDSTTNEPEIKFNVLTRNFKSIFKDDKDYERIISQLVNLKLVVISNDGLIFKGFKYQMAEIFNALYDNGLIENFNDKGILEIAMNTFKDFKSTDRTLRGVGFGKTIALFKQFLV